MRTEWPQSVANLRRWPWARLFGREAITRGLSEAWRVEGWGYFECWPVRGVAGGRLGTGTRAGRKDPCRAQGSVRGIQEDIVDTPSAQR